MQHGDRAQQALHFRRTRLHLRARRVDVLELPESERRLGAVDRQRDEPAAITAEGRLVTHPVRSQRRPGPQDDDRLCAVQRVLGLAGEALAAFDQAIPPDAVTRPLEHIDDGARLLDVLVCVADEDAGRRTPGPFGFIRSGHPRACRLHRPWVRAWSRWYSLRAEASPESGGSDEFESVLHLCQRGDARAGIRSGPCRGSTGRREPRQGRRGHQGRQGRLDRAPPRMDRAADHRQHGREHAQGRRVHAPAGAGRGVPAGEDRRDRRRARRVRDARRRREDHARHLLHVRREALRPGRMVVAPARGEDRRPAGRRNDAGRPRRGQPERPRDGLPHRTARVQAGRGQASRQPRARRGGRRGNRLDQLLEDAGRPGGQRGAEGLGRRGDAVDRPVTRRLGVARPRRQGSARGPARLERREVGQGPGQGRAFEPDGECRQPGLAPGQGTRHAGRRRWLHAGDRRLVRERPSPHASREGTDR